MALLDLRPTGKSYIWGGTRLSNEYGKGRPGEKLAETWELSCHPDGACFIENGINAGQTLSEYLGDNPSAAGEHCGKFGQFPVLIKLIDAKSDLSVQVHPDDAFALSHEGQLGKTEMWYIVDCEEGACIYWGLKQQVSREELEKSIADNTLTDLLNRVEVKKGDCFFIEAGTIHAIGKGILVAEVQQSSNVTYRVYDYGRLDAEGKPRQLHVDKALAVANLSPAVRRDFGGHLAKCDYFTVDRIDVDGDYSGATDGSSFHSILVLDGKGVILCGDEWIEVEKGSSVMVTADSGKYRMYGKCEALLTTV